MIFLKKIIYIFPLIICACSVLPSKKPAVKKATTNVPVVSNSPNNLEPSVLKVGDLNLTKADFRIQIENFIDIDSLPTETIKKEVIKRQLFLQEARKMGLEDDPEFLEEYETYKKIYTDKLLFDSLEINKLKEESFKNYQKEINVSHIFLPLSSYADPQDTLKLYQDLMALKNNATKNNNFETLAKDNSKDTKTNNKGGRIGWLTSLNLIYPLENVAFKLSVDSISDPIRTKSGYHLLKINATRPNSGMVKVQHIIKYLPANVTEIEFTKKSELMDSLKQLLNEGANFNDIVMKYSDDQVSKNHNGELPIFGIGNREESIFEEAAFKLKPNEISKLVKSSSGFHIIRLVERYKPLNKANYFKSISDKITTDSRGEYLLKQKIKTLTKAHKFLVQSLVYEQCLNLADYRILTKNWTFTNSELQSKVLFTINGKSTTALKYLSYVKDRQKYEKWKSNDKPKEIFKMLFDSFLNKKLIENEQNRIVNDNPTVKQLLKAQKEDLIISKFRNEMFLEKSMADSVGLRKFYELNKSQFPPKEKGKLRVLKFENESTFRKFNTERYKPKPFQLNRGLKPIYFTKDETTLNIENKRKLFGLISILAKNPGYIVEIGGHADAAEIESASQDRIKTVVAFLVENGLPLTRILEMDYKTGKVADRFDWTKNQRVNFQFFSNLESDLVKLFNTKKANSIEISDLEINKKQAENEIKLPWKTGVTIKNEGEIIQEYTLKLKGEKSTSAFRDNKAEIIKGYQMQLENDLIKRIQVKYKVNLDSMEANKIIEEIKKEK